jgi:hypothetical protein
MEKNKKIDFKNFEMLTGNGGILKGGFSSVSSPSDLYGGTGITNDKCVISNNCKGGNCATGCGQSGGSGGGYVGL